MTIRRGALLGCLVIGLVTGCGGDDGDDGGAGTDKDAIKQAITGYYDALAAEDAAAACNQLTSKAQAEIVRFASAVDRGLTGRGCEKAVQKSALASGGGDYTEVGKKVSRGNIAIDGDSARIAAMNRLTVRLVRDGDAWRIDSLGLKPLVAADELTPQESVALASANVAVARYCLDAIGFLIGKRASPPSPGRSRAKDRAIDTLIRLLRQDPDAKLDDGSTVEDAVIEAISTLERSDCDSTAARRLDRTLTAAGG